MRIVIWYIVIGIIIIVISYKLELSWRIVVTILIAVVLFDILYFAFFDDKVEYWLEQILPDNPRSIVNEETSTVILVDGGNYYERLALRLLIPALITGLIPICIVILGMVLKVLIYLVLELIDLIKEIAKKIYDEMYISYLTVNTQGLGDIVLKKDCRKNIVTNTNIIDIKTENYNFYINNIKYDAKKEVTLLEEIFDYIFYHGDELYKKCLDELHLISSEDDFDLEEWIDWMGINGLDLIICFDTMILKPHCFSDKSVMLKIDWETKEFNKG